MSFTFMINTARAYIVTNLTIKNKTRILHNNIFTSNLYFLAKNFFTDLSITVKDLTLWFLEYKYMCSSDYK